MDYVLVADDCNDCCYVSNALTLLRLPHKKLAAHEIQPETISNSIATIVCTNIQPEQKSKIVHIAQSIKKSIISWGNGEAFSQLMEGSLHLLKMPFSKYELKNTLLKSTNYAQQLPNLNNPAFEKLVGPSQLIRDLKSLILQVAPSDTTVMVLGQSGTGKDIVASCIHQLSSRYSHPFVPINCGAIPGELMESELFGHEKGAFTGALTRRSGRFEIANRGTLFLDEVGDMPLPMQVKLLRVIQERKVERVGGNNSIDVDVRLIAATHKKLEEMIKKHEFREDLFYRLNVFPIYVPTLQERKEDIPATIDYQLEKIYERLKHRVVFTEQALGLLCDYSWPGNIRELQNFLERMVILYPDYVVSETQINLAGKTKPRRSRTATVATLVNK